MKLTPKQELFIQHYTADRQSNELSIEYVIKGIICCYLRSESECNKKHSAWLIKRIKPTITLVGINELLDMKEVYRLAQLKQADIQKLAKFAQERRHERRNDFALTDEEWVLAVEHFDNECGW